MADQIQVNVYKIDDTVQLSKLTLSILTRDTKSIVASTNIPEVKSVIYYYDTPNATTQFKKLYVSESIDNILTLSNDGIYTQIKATVIEINGNKQLNGGIKHLFPIEKISIFPFSGLGINSFIEFKGDKYFCSETEVELKSAINNNSTSPSSGGTVTDVSVVTANGFAGSVSNSSTTPAITIITTVSGIIKGNGTAISAATSGTDYSAGTSALTTGIIKSTTGTGNLSIAVAADFPTLNQNTTGSAGSVSGTNVITNANLRQGVARSVIGVTGNATSNVADIQGSTNQILRVDSTGTALAFGSIDISQSASVTGILGVANGGTGTSTQFTPGSIVFAGSAGVYTQDNSNLFFNDSSNFLGVRVGASPTQAIDVQGNIQNIYGTNSAFSIVGTVNLSGNNGFSIFVQGKYAYVTDLSGSKLSVVDVSTPSAPTEVGSVTLTGQLRGIYVQGRYAYIASASPGNLMYVVDVSNPSTPTSVGSVAVTDARSITVSGKYAFVFSNNGASSTVKIIDIRTPTTPSIIGSATMDNGVCGKMDVKGNYLFASSSTNSTISIFDITDPTIPTLVGGRFNTGGTFQLETSGRYLYTINTSGRLAVVDISNPASPVLANTPATFTANGSMFLAGRYLYLVDSSNSLLRIVDVSNPASPVLAITTSTGASPSSVFVSGRYAYLTYSTNPDKISIIDIGGIESNTIKTSTAIIGKASITESIDIVGSATIGTGLSVGNEGIYTTGSIAGTWGGTAIAATSGGTGQTSYAVGDLLYASTTTALSKLADVAAGSYLRSGGVNTAPVWSSTTLPNSATTGDLIYASASNAYSNLAAVATGKELRSAGVGVAPVYATAGGSVISFYLNTGQSFVANGFLGLAGDGSSTINVNITPWVVPIAGTLTNLRVFGLANTVGNVHILIYKASNAVSPTYAATTLDATVSTGTCTANDTTHSVSVNAGDLIVAFSGSAWAANGACVNVMFTPS